MLYELRFRIKSLARWENNTVKILGVIEIILGVMLLVPTLISLYYGEDPYLFIYPVPILLFLGIFQYVFFKSRDVIKPASGMMMMFIAWWISFFVSSIPFYLYGFSFVDSLFEGISGFTTTGATIVDLPELLPSSIIFWRSFAQWAGGIAIVLIFLFLIPMMGIGGKAFVNNELAGYQSYNFSMRLRNAAKNFVSIYVLLSIVEMILLVVCGVDMFDSVTLTFSTISTGGLMGTNSGMADFSIIVQGIVLVFMFLGGTNFYLHFRAIYKKDFSAYRKSQEFIWTIIWFLVAAVIISVIILYSAVGVHDIDLGYIGETAWNSIFTVVSVGTTTGYTITDQSVWPTAAFMILWLVMLFGSMSGSTSGGIKIYRLLIIKSYITNGIYRMFHPRSVRDVRLDRHSVDQDSVVSAIVVVIMFMVTLAFSTILLLIIEPGLALDESIGLSLSSISNGGMDTGGVSIHELGDISKVFLAFMMWVGRLEVVIVLLLFSKTFWRDLFSGWRWKHDGVSRK